MCGIAGILSLQQHIVPNIEHRLDVMSHLQKHRGPDGQGKWIHPNSQLGFCHRRLSIIDLTDSGNQPMSDEWGNCLIYNGEIYNYIELRNELMSYGQPFYSNSDTEVLLAAYRHWGVDCVTHLRGMFAFALWDEPKNRLFCARDRFGIKPFCYTQVDDVFYFASEIKALLPFQKNIQTNIEGFKDYLSFQFCLGGKTLFSNIYELQPANLLTVSDGTVTIKKYWEVYYNLDYNHTAKYFEEQVRAAVIESANIHLRSDVPVGAYLSGGLDSSTVASIAQSHSSQPLLAFTGKFSFSPDYDESKYAQIVANTYGFELHELDITANDFIDNIHNVIYHLDYPIAGPGSFAQYMISQLAAKYRKVVLGGQGGDEIFGGYTRYLVAYFEQCIKAAIDGTSQNGNFVVTYESIISNLTALRNYKPMLQEFWRDGLFGPMDARYFRLINRAPILEDEIKREKLGEYSPFSSFCNIFNSNNIQKESYFDRMTHFDFKTLLPSLLQVEDRVSMAHGLESRVPLLDHKLVEIAATIPSDIKFKNGDMKHLFKQVVKPFVPEAIYNRQDKMGFPTPVVEWAKGQARDFVFDTFSSAAAQNRDLINNKRVLDGLKNESKYGRKLWGLLSLEIWQQQFHDRASDFSTLL